MIPLASNYETIEYKKFEGAQWLKIFHHTSANGYFSKSDEAMFSNSPGKFSIMRLVNESFMYKGKYEMLIECPKPYEGFIWWRQSHFPNPDDSAIDSGSYVSGFELNSKSTFTKSIEGHTFTGLSRSRQKYTLFDGTNGDHWFFAIGQYSTTNGGIPCYQFGSEVTLWIRTEPPARIENGISPRIGLIPLVLFHL